MNNKKILTILKIMIKIIKMNNIKNKIIKQKMNKFNKLLIQMKKNKLNNNNNKKMRLK